MGSLVAEAEFTVKTNEKSELRFVWLSASLPQQEPVVQVVAVDVPLALPAIDAPGAVG